MWIDLLFHYTGMAVIVALIAIFFVGLIGGAILLIMSYWPRFHMGCPKNDGEIRFYDPVDTYDGKPVLISEPLRIRWWLGLSLRNSSKWWFGLMRFEEPQ